MQFDAGHIALIEGAIAIEAVNRCAEGFSRMEIDYQMAQAIDRLIKDADYRMASLATHGELFTAGDAPEKLVFVMEKVQQWNSDKVARRSASHTGDTAPTSREKHTKP